MRSAGAVQVSPNRRSASLAHLPGAVVVAPGVYSAAGVLAHEHHRDVDVVLGVPDSDPAAGAGVVTTGQAGAVQQVLDNLGPLRIRQHPVARGVAQRAVPHRTAAAGVMAVAGRFERHACGQRRVVEVLGQRRARRSRTPTRC